MRLSIVVSRLLWLPLALQVLALPDHPNWGDYSVTVQYDMNALRSTFVVWNAHSLSKASEDWKYWSDIMFNKKYGTKAGYQYRLEDGLCGIKHETMAPVHTLWSDLPAVYIGKHVVNGAMCHGWKQDLFSDFILTYTSVATSLPVQEIHVTKSYNTTSTYLEFIPGVPSPSHFEVPSSCPPPPAVTSGEVGFAAAAAKRDEFRRRESSAVKWHMAQAKPIVPLTTQFAEENRGQKLRSAPGPVVLEQITLQPFQFSAYGPVPPNSLIYLQYNIRTLNGNNVDVFFLDGDNYQKFKSGVGFSYFVTYSRVDVSVADFPAQTFRGGGVEYYLVIRAVTWAQPIVMDVQVNLRHQKSVDVETIAGP